MSVKVRRAPHGLSAEISLYDDFIVITLEKDPVSGGFSVKGYVKMKGGELGKVSLSNKVYMSLTVGVDRKDLDVLADEGRCINAKAFLRGLSLASQSASWRYLEETFRSLPIVRTMSDQWSKAYHDRWEKIRQDFNAKFHPFTLTTSEEQMMTRQGRPFLEFLVDNVYLTSPPSGRGNTRAKLEISAIAQYTYAHNVSLFAELSKDFKDAFRVEDSERSVEKSVFSGFLFRAHSQYQEMVSFVANSVRKHFLNDEVLKRTLEESWKNCVVEGMMGFFRRILKYTSEPEVEIDPPRVVLDATFQPASNYQLFYPTSSEYLLVFVSDEKFNEYLVEEFLLQETNPMKIISLLTFYLLPIRWVIPHAHRALLLGMKALSSLKEGHKGNGGR